jgi:acyl-CoA hydrolase
MRGTTTKERAVNLIGIAAPAFREELEKAARGLGLI